MKRRGADNSAKVADGTAPRGRPFKPGQSGNPGGRPTKDVRMRRIEDMAREYSEDALKALRREAMTGKGAPMVAAAIALLDRGWGRPVERKESGEAGAFDGLTDSEVEAEAKAALAEGVKAGFIKVLPPVKK